MDTLQDLIKKCELKSTQEQVTDLSFTPDTLYYLTKGSVLVFLREKSQSKQHLKFYCFTIHAPCVLLPFMIIGNDFDKDMVLKLQENTVVEEYSFKNFTMTAKENFAINIAAKAINAWIAIIASSVNLYYPSNMTKYMILQDGVTADYNKFIKKIFLLLLKRWLHHIKSEKKRFKQAIKIEKKSLNDALLTAYQALTKKKATILAETQYDNFIACMNFVGKQLDIPIATLPTNEYDSHNIEKNIDYICRGSGIFYREITLRKNWWDKDNGMLFCVLKSNKKPVILLPNQISGYSIWLSETNETKEITREYIDDISPVAYILCPVFIEPILGHAALFRHAFKLNWRESMVIIVLSILTGLIALALPIVTGMVFDEVIPWAMHSELFQFGIFLITLTVLVSIFSLAQNYLITRVETKLSNSILSMVWGRVLQLSVDFFKKYPVGDFMTRFNGLSLIQSFLANSFITLLLSLCFAIFSLCLLFYYSITLATVALGIIVFSIFINFLFDMTIFIYSNRQVEMQGQLIGVFQQIVKAITKIRAGHAEKRVFKFFSQNFGKIVKLNYIVEMLSNAAGIFNNFFTIAAIIILYAIMSLKLTKSLEIGQFIAFMTAFYILFDALTRLVGILSEGIRLWPYYKRLRPLLVATPERSLAKNNPGILKGKIAIEHLSFHYPDDTNPRQVLKDINMEILPGQTIAIVGHSGSGKSTLLKLLLGFYHTQQGGIFYDDKDMNLLDLYLLRSQFGVVLQNDQLMPGDIYTNIVGITNLSIDDAWEAAYQVGIAQDIKKMPMQMYTRIGDSDSGLSGGQRQKVLLAKAIVKKPKILFLDESMSALDNISQAQVIKAIKSLPMTKIMIAHRLSTIRNADYIYVIDNGQIVEKGVYDVLINAQGVFSKLAHRQITSEIQGML